MLPNPYDRDFQTTHVHRALRIPARELFSSPDPDSPREHTTPADTHIVHARAVHTPLSGIASSSQLALLPTPTIDPAVELEIMREAMATLRAQNERLRVAAEPKPLSVSFNPAITSVPTCLVLPPLPAGVNFNTPHGFLANLPNFCGLPSENALLHIKSFLTLCATHNEQIIGIDAYRLRVFPLTLLDRATTWLDQLPTYSVHTWADL